MPMYRATCDIISFCPRTSYKYATCSIFALAHSISIPLAVLLFARRRQYVLFCLPCPYLIGQVCQSVCPALSSKTLIFGLGHFGDLKLRRDHKAPLPGQHHHRLSLHSRRFSTVGPGTLIERESFLSPTYLVPLLHFEDLHPHLNQPIIHLSL